MQTERGPSLRTTVEAYARAVCPGRRFRSIVDGATFARLCGFAVPANFAELIMWHNGGFK